MRIVKISYCTVFAVIFIGCAAAPIHHSDPAKVRSLASYNRHEIQTSLFEDDKSVIDDAAVQKILDGYVAINDGNTVAVYKMDNQYSGFQKYYGYGYWLSEEYLDLQQQYFDIIKGELAGCPKVNHVKVLPSILTPSKLTVSKLREAAVRMQAALMVVYSIQSDIFEEFHIFRANEVKAYATCEMILFDTRTGIIPFSEVSTKKYLTTQEKTDSNIRETRKRAEKEAILETLRDLSKKLNVFFASR